MKKKIIFLSQWRIVVSLMVMFCLGLFYWFNDYHLSWFVKRDPVIVLTDRGFKPKKIYVKVGEVVTYKTALNMAFWPASNMHPDHTFYPEFDAGRPILPTEEWSFEFMKPGTWEYHDHLSPNFKGEVVVLTKDGKVDSHLDCRTISLLSYEDRQYCWYLDFKDMLQDEDVGTAFDYFKTLYNRESDFRSGCHDVTHLIGSVAFERFKYGKNIKFDESTTYCGYGFYHGFVESLAYDGFDLEYVKDFCLGVGGSFEGDIKSPNATYSCFHGIGHATFDNQDYSLWGDEKKMANPALRMCEQLTEGMEFELKKQCVTGVYNALANAYSQRQYGLEINKEDPFWFCQSQNKELRKYCYLEVSVSWVASKYGIDRYTFRDIDIESRSISDIEDKKMVVLGLVSEYTRRHIDDLNNNDLAKLCNIFADSDLLFSCVEGVVLGLVNWGEPTKEIEGAFGFCDQKEIFGYDAMRKCFEYVLPRVGTVYGEERTQSICDSISYDELRSLCR